MFHESSPEVWCELGCSVGDDRLRHEVHGQGILPLWQHSEVSTSTTKDYNGTGWQKLHWLSYGYMWCWINLKDVYHCVDIPNQLEQMTRIPKIKGKWWNKNWHFDESHILSRRNVCFRQAKRQKPTLTADLLIFFLPWTIWKHLNNFMSGSNCIREVSMGFSSQNMWPNYITEKKWQTINPFFSHLSMWISRHRSCIKSCNIWCRTQCNLAM